LIILKSIIIGIVEGITEFLPISSTGHMIIVESLINFKGTFADKNFVDMYDVIIQLGAILAVVVLFWNKIKDSIINFETYGFRLWKNIFIAFVPVAILGALLNSKIEEYLFGPFTVIAALILGGFLMLYMENKFRKGNSIRSIDDVNSKQAVIIGLFQCLSLWPGMSRSASTIMGGWFSGLANVAAAEFSFFLAMPTMVAASGFKILKAVLKHQVAFNFNEIVALVVTFIVSFFVALVVVDKFIGFLKKKPMRVFAIYRIIVGLLLIVGVVTKIISFA
jgi:undecaprenyl-diphosphatase UppP